MLILSRFVGMNKGGDGRSWLFPVMPTTEVLRTSSSSSRLRLLSEACFTTSRFLHPREDLLGQAIFSAMPSGQFRGTDWVDGWG